MKSKKPASSHARRASEISGSEPSSSHQRQSSRSSRPASSNPSASSHKRHESVARSGAIDSLVAQMQQVVESRVKLEMKTKDISQQIADLKQREVQLDEINQRLYQEIKQLKLSELVSNFAFTHIQLDPLQIQLHAVHDDSLRLDINSREQIDRLKNHFYYIEQALIEQKIDDPQQFLNQNGQAIRRRAQKTVDNSGTKQALKELKEEVSQFQRMQGEHQETIARQKDEKNQLKIARHALQNQEDLRQLNHLKNKKEHCKNK